MSPDPPPATPDGAVLLTGATGFVGMEVLARFLERSERHVVALVRAADDAQAAARVRATLQIACGDGDAHAGRVTAVAFDLTLERAREINVEGTRQMLELARACPHLERFTYVSTAYVAGERRGIVYEDDIGGGRFRNSYERTKHEAERLVAGQRDAMDVTIVRPSIVVGDRNTGWTAAFNVLYAPLRALEAGAYPVVPARRNSPVDVVPVDYVADAVHALAEAPEAAGQTFHVVAGSGASTVGEIVSLASTRFRRPPPHIVPPRAYHALVAPLVTRRASRSARRLLASSEPYFPYFAMRLRFDDARARAVLEPRGIRATPLRAYFDRLLDYALAARWGRRPIGRSHAGQLSAT